MSWLKRRGQSNAQSPGPDLTHAEPVPMYNPNQPVMQNQWQHNNWQQQHHIPTPTTQQAYWEQPKTNIQSYGQQYQGQYQNQNNFYGSETMVEPQGNQQDFSNVQYNQKLDGTESGAVQTLPQQTNETSDAWGNWGWGEDDNSNLSNDQSNQQYTADLAGNVANEESWNWSVEDNTTVNQKVQNVIDNAPKITPHIPPHFATVGKRNKLETPQWSIESQVSQESSDDVLQTSESDNHQISSSTVSRSPLDNVQTPKDDIFFENHAGIVEETIKPSGNGKELVTNIFQQPSPSQMSFPQLKPYTEESKTIRKVSISPQPNQFVSIPPRQNASQSFQHSANLETFPDNSEQPDVGSGLGNAFVPYNPPRQQNWPENNEAPMNDRNQYLETGQLSEAIPNDFVNEVRSNQEDALPPPGLRRMVLGQMEQRGNAENFYDEPPPGLSRMVLGQNENISTISNGADFSNTFEPINPPEGLRRMVPGESSSPEITLRRPDDADVDFGVVAQRSATIGADTPPATSSSATLVAGVQSNTNIAPSRSETIGAHNEKPKSSKQPQTSVNKKSTKKMGRRDDIEGRTEMDSVVSGVRNLTVGENSTDDANDYQPKVEPRRRMSRQDTSESELEKTGNKSPRERKDRRSKTDKRDNDNYSPDLQRADRRYDRRKYRDRRYEEDDDDYFSDEDRDKGNKIRENDKKYHSLRRDHEKDRKRRESPRFNERENRRRRDDYYHHHRYDDPYENEGRSSRSDSMYRGGGAEKDRRRDKGRRSRDAFNMYPPQGFGAFDPYNPYYHQYQYQYYQNLSRTNPQAYAEMYRKYYEQQTSSTRHHQAAYGNADDVSSVHSGRSSLNDDPNKSRFTMQSYYSPTGLPYMVGYYNRDSKTNSISDRYDFEDFRIKDQSDSLDGAKGGRTTPAKFNSAHTKVSIGSGRLVKVPPNYPQDGQTALVELASLGAFLQNDEEYRELSFYPGPLIKDLTHKKTVIEYCEHKIRNVDPHLPDSDSYVLLWDLLVLLLRQNGKVVGTDIAELLLKNRPDNVQVRSSSSLSNVSSNNVSEKLSETNENSIAPIKEEEVTSKFREYLLYGSGQEALEWAMKHGLWGHALFLASKLGKRTYSNVMIRFANGLTFNDPLQTLYQLLSGRMPAAVSGVADEKWGDWRPHLAMILSNSSLQPELNRKAITTLGDTLLSRGSLYAAHFCYLMAEVPFGRYGASQVRLVLLGADHRHGSFERFATNEAVHMTEIYEYACSLNDPEFALPELQFYKYLLATKLADRGLIEKSIGYLEKVAGYILKNQRHDSLTRNVCELADRLKYYDLLEAEDEMDQFGNVADNRLDASWLSELRALINDSTFISRETFDDTLKEPISIQQDENQQSNFYAPQYQSEYQYAPLEKSNDFQYGLLQENPPHNEQQQFEGYQSSVYQPEPPQQQFWPEQQSAKDWEGAQNLQTTPNVSQDVNRFTQNEEQPKPQISIPNRTTGKSIYDDEPLPHEKTLKTGQKAEEAKRQQPQKENGSGWFGGIFSKLALKPKNQMKLPDDKNPSIVWDDETKRWVNQDEDNSGSATKPIAPPKTSDWQPSEQKFSTPVGVPPDNRTNQNNLFKLQKSRNLKKSYVDVFNPSGGGGARSPLDVPGFPTSQQATPQASFFVPQPVDNRDLPTNFLTQGSAPSGDQQDYQ